MCHSQCCENLVPHLINRLHHVLTTYSSKRQCELTTKTDGCSYQCVTVSFYSALWSVNCLRLSYEIQERSYDCFKMTNLKQKLNSNDVYFNF